MDVPTPAVSSLSTPFRIGTAAAVITLSTYGAWAQVLQFASRHGETVVYCGIPGTGPLTDHVFDTAAPTDDAVSVSDNGAGGSPPTSAQSHLVATLGPSSLFIDVSGSSQRGNPAPNGANAVADARDSWNLNIPASACFRLTISIDNASTEATTPQDAFNFVATAPGRIHLNDGTSTQVLTNVLSSPGSFTAIFTGTLDPGQYFLSIFGRTDGSQSPFAGSFHGHAEFFLVSCPCSSDFNNDGDIGTDADIEAFFACLGGNCCASCGSADFNADGDTGTDADIESFFRVLGGGNC